MRTSERYEGNPVAKHLVIESMQQRSFERWLASFDETCGELFDDRLSKAFCVKAAHIVKSLKLALFYRPDQNGHLSQQYDLRRHRQLHQM